MNIQELKERVLGHSTITPDEALWLLTLAPKKELYDAAHEITIKMASNHFDSCSIINARSGKCSENCKWCAQSAHYCTSAEVYPLVETNETLRHARHHHNQKIGRIAIVTSGRKPTANDLQKIAAQIKEMKDSVDIHRCASLGLLNKNDLTKLFTAGLERYHCNLETAPSYFEKLCTTHTQAEKIKTLEAAREVGLELCCGGILGMGESEAQRVEFAFTLRNLKIQSIPLNLLQPIPGTPLEHQSSMTDDEVLSAIAMFRFVNPSAYLRFAGGRAQLSHPCIEQALYIGINSAIMGDMLTTLGSKVEQDKLLIKNAGYEF